MINSYFLRGFILIGIILMIGCTKTRNITGYQYIDIKECSIPILNDLYLKDGKPDKFKYLFVSRENNFFNDNRLDPQIKVMPNVDKKHLIMLQSSLNKLGDEKSIDKINDIEIWYLQEYVNNTKLNLFSYIFLKDSVISVINHTKREIEYIVNYCNKHRKSRT